jgi:hypothetical protein
MQHRWTPRRTAPRWSMRAVARPPPRRWFAGLVGARPAPLDCGRGQQWSPCTAPCIPRPGSRVCDGVGSPCVASRTYPWLSGPKPESLGRRSGAAPPPVREPVPSPGRLGGFASIDLVRPAHEIPPVAEAG